MKHKADPFSAALTPALALLLALSLAACSDHTKPPQRSAVLAKAEKIEISIAQYDGLPLAGVIDMLHDESVRRDPAKIGVSISLGPDAQKLAGVGINLELKDVTLAEALRQVADSVGLKVQATDTGLLLVAKNAK